MGRFVSKWRYELMTLGIALLGVVINVNTSDPVVQGSINVSRLRNVVQTLDGRANDLKFRIRGEVDAHPQVVVVEIDEASNERFGLYPWSRAHMAKALHNILASDAKAVGFDVTFADRFETESDLLLRSTLSTLNALDGGVPSEVEDLRQQLIRNEANSPDELLARVFREGGARVVQGVIPSTKDDGLLDSELKRSESLLGKYIVTHKVLPTGLRAEVPLDNLSLPPYQSMLMPLAIFEAAGNRLGSFMAAPDGDGPIRRYPVLVKLERPKGMFPSLALSLAAASLDAEISPEWSVEEKQVSAVSLVVPGKPRVTIPLVRDQGQFLVINYPGTKNQYARYSIVDVIDGKVGKAQLSGKTVLVGLTIIGSSGDQRVTPFKEIEPGVFVHAAVVSNILNGDFLVRPGETDFYEAIAMAILSLFMGFAVSRTRLFALKAFILVATLAGWLLVDYFAFTVAHTQLATFVPVLTITIAAFATIFLGYISVDREKGKLRSTFTRYLGEDVMEAAIADPEKLNKGEKREMTVLFSDIRGFTTMSEKMAPEVLMDFINQYLSPMTSIVFEEKGTLDKYIGDAVMAFWNAPLEQKDHAVRACRAAIKMLVKLDELKVKWKAEGYPDLDIGIGINTGQMVVGNMGSDVRVDYTILGDSVNLGARLEGTNKEYDTKIIISEFTYRHAKDEVICRKLGAVRVKGKKLPVAIYELRGIGKATGIEAEAINSFERALEAWVGRNFDEAERLFQHVLTIWKNDSTTQNYLAEIAEFRETPPPADWDGVVTLKTK